MPTKVLKYGPVITGTEGAPASRRCSKTLVVYKRCYRNVVVRLLLFSLLLQIEYVKQGVDQKLQDGQEKLHQMWLDWSKRQTGGSKDTELVQPEVSN